MHVTAADRWELPAGTVTTRTFRACGAGAPVALTVNQRNHLGGLRPGAASVWLAAAVPLDGPAASAPAGALLDAVAGVLDAHPALRTAVGPDGGGVVHPRSGLVATDVVAAPTDAAGTVAALRAALDVACDPRSGHPPLVLAHVAAAPTSWLVVAADHLVVDAWSVAVLARDAAAAAGVPLAPAVTAPAPPGDFHARAAAWSAAPPLPPDDPRLAGWVRFLEAQDFALPTFPLLLGLAPGERRPQETDVATLVDATTATALAAVAAGAGVSTYAVVLAALADAVAALGGPARLPLLLPVGTRTPADAGTVGWFTTTVPLVVGAGDGVGAVGDALRGAVELASAPLDQVLAGLPCPLVRRRDDVFMVSWLDYRRAPVVPAGTQHVSAATDADDVQLWLSRTVDGVAVRVRRPAGAVPARTVAGLLDAWREALRRRAAG